MCHAIVRVKYVADKSATLIEVSNERDLQSKVNELQGKDQVVSIQVFPRNHDIVLTKQWEKRVYSPPVEVGPTPVAQAA